MNKYCNNIITKLTKPKVTVVKKNEEIFHLFSITGGIFSDISAALKFKQF